MYNGPIMANDRITVKLPKPRALRVNEVLRSKKGGPMRSIKDYNRQAEKKAAREALAE